MGRRPDFALTGQACFVAREGLAAAPIPMMAFASAGAAISRPGSSVEENLTVAARPGRWHLRAACDLFRA
jgi:hypothetical protein